MQMWVKIESWHLEKDDESGESWCGRDLVDAPVERYEPELPLSEKSCETCLRLWSAAQANETNEG